MLICSSNVEFYLHIMHIFLPTANQLFLVVLLTYWQNSYYNYVSINYNDIVFDFCSEIKLDAALAFFIEYCVMKFPNMQKKLILATIV